MSDVSEILKGLEKGEPQATEELLPLVYDELRRLAAHQLSQEDSTQTLQPTALVHEAYLRLVGSSEPQWSGRHHFFATAAEAMRRILIDRARRKKSQKHGGGWQKVDWEQADVAAAMPPAELLALDEALVRLEQVDEQAAKLIKLRFFVGLTHQDAGAILGLSRGQADGLWAHARAWLFRELRESSIS